MSQWAGEGGGIHLNIYQGLITLHILREKEGLAGDGLVGMLTWRTGYDLTLQCWTWHYVQLGGCISALKLKGGTLLIFLKNLSAGISTKIGVQLNFHMTKKNLGSKISKVTHLIVKNDIEDDECS